MACVVAWAVEAGHKVEPFGVDLSEALVRLARTRLPGWASRIVVGNAITWQPAGQFDFVRTELVYVPPDRERALVERLLRDLSTANETRILRKLRMTIALLQGLELAERCT